MLGVMKDLLYHHGKTLKMHFKILRFLGTSIVEAEFNKLNLERRDQNYLF